MDKYAPYVWTSYGIAIGLLVCLSLFVVLRLKKAKDKLDRISAEEN